MPVMSHEIAVLIQLTVWLSGWLNIKVFGITADDKPRRFRFNLRFLADYRKLITICITMYIRSLL
jgi:hypothetical protein